MSKKRNEAFYKQCALQRKNTHHMAWIPESFAVEGKFIKIKKDDGTWEDGWEVMSDGGEVRRSAKEANQQSDSNNRFGSSIKV